MVLAGLGWLAGADVASVPAAVQAECLRGLERAQSVYAAARAPGAGGVHGAGRLRGRRAGIAADVADLADQDHPRRRRARRWRRCGRLAAHPAIAGALAGGAISVSWARQIADWTDLLPGDCRGDADVILLAAAAGGADLDGLAELAEEIRRRTARPDRDRDDGFEDRALRLATTLGGAGRLHADLTARAPPPCRPSWTRWARKPGRRTPAPPPSAATTPWKRAAGGCWPPPCLPDRAGQPVRLQLCLTLDDFLNGAGGHGGDSAPGPVLPGPAAGPGDDCDAALAPDRHRPRRPRPGWTASPPSSPAPPALGRVRPGPAAARRTRRRPAPAARHRGDPDGSAGLDPGPPPAS